MKTKLHYFFVALALLALSTLNSQLSALHAQGTAFTYQGRLNSSGSPASGLYDFRFKLAADPLGNTSATGYVLTNGVPVINGLFAVTIDFGTGIFNGSNYWLDVEVRTNNPANNLNYTVLTPLQAVTPAPYAIFANTASNVVGAISSASLSGTYGSAVNLNNSGNSFSGSYSGNGANVTNVNAATLSGLNATNFWQLGGNTVSTGQFLGSTNNQPLTLIADGSPAVVITPNASGPEIVLGTAQNTIASSSPGSSILGGNGNVVNTGSSYSVIGGGQSNSVTLADGFIGGGVGNVINYPGDFIGGGGGNFLNASANSVIGGGNVNTVVGSSSAVIGGGWQNTIDTGAYYAFLGGGQHNYIGAANSVLVGGFYNTNSTYAYNSFLGGGANNLVSGNYASVPGGYKNFAGGEYSFAAGQQAQANNQGAFVWADSQNAPFASTNSDSFNVRAQGGVRMVTGGAGMTVDGQPVLAGTLSFAQLTGTLSPAQLPVGLVSNNEPLTSLGALFVSALTTYGSLNLPSPATITSGFTPILSVDTSDNIYIAGNVGLGTTNTVAQLNVAASQTSAPALNITQGSLKVAGAGFNTATTAFILVATTNNLVDPESIEIDNPICNGNSNAILIVTHNYTASGVSGGYDGQSWTDPIGVAYNGYYSRNKWDIFDETGYNPIPLGMAFNVLVIVP